MSSVPTQPNEEKTSDPQQANTAYWETRKQLAYLLYNQGSFNEAAEVIWAADEIPSIDIELAFAARILAKASPRKAIRLLTALLEHNRGKAVQNLGLANALLHHGMVLQAVRFYGAALEADPTLGNPDLEHFILWTDDEERLWGDFQNRRPNLGELPWMKRDPNEALKLAKRISHHTTPIKLPSLPASPGEKLSNELYQQKPQKGAEPSPPPSVTIPLDRVDPKHRLFDSELGARSPHEASMPTAVPAVKQLAKPDFTAAGAAVKPRVVPAAQPTPTVPLFRSPPPSITKGPLPPSGTKTQTAKK